MSYSEFILFEVIIGVGLAIIFFMFEDYWSR